MSCRSVRDWLHRESDTLDNTQQLQFDDHLAACERCRRDRDHLQLLHRAGTSLTVPPAGAREYNRAIARALLEGSTRRGTAPRAGMWIVAGSIAAVAAAAVVAIVVFARNGDDATPRAARQDTVPAPAHAPRTPPAPGSTTQNPEPATDMVEDGALTLDGTPLERGDAIPTNAPLRTIREARVRLAMMRVVIAANSQIRWSPSERTLLLERGMIELDADKTEPPAHVVTSGFSVEISDTAVAIEPGAVRVRRGAARIVDRNGKLLAHLEAEGTWEPSSAPAVRRPSRVTHDKSATDLMALAREQFAAKHYAAAERLAERALATADARREQADAQIFLADVAQAAGDLELAVTRYETVATKFAELPAAESALYAGARIELRRGRQSAAQVLLDRYLDRYPTGRYADDVRQQRTSPR